MPAFLVTSSTSDPTTRVEKTDAVTVFAADAADAIAMAKSRRSGDGVDTWDNATATQLVADADLEGWRIRVRVAPPGGGPVSGRRNTADVTFTGLAAATMDDMGAGLVILLNATPDIAASIYTSATNVLTVAAIADALGDHTVLAELLPPVAGNPGAVAIPGGVVAVTDEGIAAADLTATLAADDYVIPGAATPLQQR